MHNRIQLRVQKVNSNAFDSMLSEEIDEYINHAIFKFIKDRFEPRSNRFQLGFEQSVKRLEDLQALIKTSELDTEEVSQEYYDNIFIDKADLPEDHFLFISAGLKIYYNDEGLTFTISSSKRTPDGDEDSDYKQKVVSAKFCQHDDIYALFADPFNKPSIKEGIFTVDNGQIYSYTNDKFITDKIILTYIRQPVTVSLSGPTDCDLSENIHPEIVDISSKLILSDIQALGAQAQHESLSDIE